MASSGLDGSPTASPEAFGSSLDPTATAGASAASSLDESTALPVVFDFSAEAFGAAAASVLDAASCLGLDAASDLDAASSLGASTAFPVVFDFSAEAFGAAAASGLGESTVLLTLEAFA